MPSTYTSRTGIELIGTGEQSGTWGETTNTNLQIIDRALNGVGTIDLSGSGASHTLTTTDGTLTDGMYKLLVLDGATEACTITISPNDAQKIYYVYNNTSYACVFTQGSGGNVSVAAGDTTIIYADGAGAGAKVTDIVALATIASSQVTGLGTAAALDAGTGANNVVQLNGSAQLPAVDGSNLTGIATAGFSVAMAIAL
jgi:hypothetical protein